LHSNKSNGRYSTTKEDGLPTVIANKKIAKNLLKEFAATTALDSGSSPE